MGLWKFIWASQECRTRVNRDQINEHCRGCMITESIIAGGQIGPDIEDECRDDEAKRPEGREKSAERTRQRRAAGQGRGEEKCDEPEAEQRQPDEREIDPEQSSNQGRKHREM